jgi:hypothetical protein
MRKKKNFSKISKENILKTLNLSSKTVAGMLNISVSKVNRLRKKYGKDVKKSNLVWKTYEKNYFVGERKIIKRRKRIFNSDDLQENDSNLIKKNNLENEIENVSLNSNFMINNVNNVKDKNKIETNIINENQKITEPLKINSSSENFETNFEEKNFLKDLVDENLSNWMKKYSL